VDAHILKWKPIVNFLGLHTAYELDRVADVTPGWKMRNQNPAPFFPLSQDKAVNIFHLRQKYALLKPLLDTEYDSGTFVAADSLLWSRFGYRPAVS